MEKLSLDFYAKQREVCRSQVNRMSKQELLDFFAANYVDNKWDRYSGDITLMGRGFPDTQVRFASVRARLEQEFPHELKEAIVEIQSLPEYRTWKTTVQKHGW